MQAPVLKIRKKVLEIQGVVRPCVQVQAIVDDSVRQVLEADFKEVLLFKRTMFANGISDRVPQPAGMLFPQLANFIKNDACPEISVKSILSGQLYQAKDPWEVLCFEWIGKRAFDSLKLMIACAVEMGTETEYAPGSNADSAATSAPSATKPALTKAA